MSDDKNNSEPFDFDFDLLNADDSSSSTGDSAFDLDNPFGDDVVVSRNEPSSGTTEDSFDLDNPFGDDLAPHHSTLDEGMDASFAGDSPVLEQSAMLGDAAEESEDSAEDEESASSILEEDVPTDGKKKGGWFSKSKSKPAKDKAIKEKPKKEAKPKKEKAIKEKKPVGERVPLDVGTILCIAFSVFLLVSLLMVNVASFFTAGGSMMQTLCFLGTFNIVGLAAASVPILFYKFPKERTLPNVMLGIAAVAMFSGVQMAIIEFYRYSFIMTP